MIEARGYCTQSFEALESAYHSRPSPLQVASYGTWIVDVVKKRDSEGLKTALACGLSSNACNTYGESLIHRVCRLGERTLLEILLEAGCDLQVADDYGRTPLHDACWSPEPSFDLVELILKRDVRLLYISDARGALPLSYVRKEHWSQWLKFLATNKDVFWPRASSDDQRVPPLLTLQKPNSKPVPAPKVSLSLELAAMVANGKMSPMEAIFLLSDDSQVEDGNNEDEESDESSEDDSDDSSDNEEVNDEDSWNEDEMNEILNSLNTGKAAPLSWSR